MLFTQGVRPPLVRYKANVARALAQARHPQAKSSPGT